ncbi:MAG: putative O-glycosylation ligase, exosortase A system-associated [Chromatiales bacterium 21-64-14]|nr:MAG: putative O-glycosylation ligase, exosortase A system-associated [Chromatiales bacterium 21-64-14]HQU16086.1 putative O-glycosylation ligase, exosortase A system-associated [Gammaproteobacteria bacterium]
MRGVAVAIIIFGSLPFILVRPWIGILMWSWIGYMNPHRLTWGFAYNYPFAMIVGVTTLAALVISREPKRLPWNGLMIMLVVFNVWVIFTSLFMLNPVAGWIEWEKVAKVQLMTFVTIMLMQDRKRLHALVWVIACSVGFFGVKGGLFTILTGGQYMVLGPPHSFMPGNTEIGLALSMTLPLFRYLQLNTESKWVRRGLGVAMALTGVAIVGTYSRGAFLAGGAMGFMLWAKSRKRALIGIGLILVVSTMYHFMPKQYFHKMDTIETYHKDRSALGRINAWWFAFHLANARPIVGGGFEAFTRPLFKKYAPEPDNYHDSHSIYFEMLGEHGYPGLMIFLTIGIMAWRYGSRTVRECRDRPDLKWASDMAAMVQVSLVAYAVGGAFLGLSYFDLAWHLVAIQILLQVLVQRHLAEAPTIGTEVAKVRAPIREFVRPPGVTADGGR